MAFQAHLTGRLEQKSIIRGSVHVVTARALDSAGIHYALNKVISLHPILVGRAIGVVSKRCLTQLVLFELPELLQLETGMEPDRPVIILALDWIRQRAPLRMALDADIVRLDRIQPRRVQNVRA